MPRTGVQLFTYLFMIEREIIILLKKISNQLEEVLANQEDLKEELVLLKREVSLFQKGKLTDLEDRIRSVAGSFH